MTRVESAIPCPICSVPLTLGLCRPSKAGKRSLQICCPVNGRHLRGFIAHQPLVEEVLDRLQRIAAGETKPPESLPARDLLDESDVS